MERLTSKNLLRAEGDLYSDESMGHFRELEG
jgi:hypothetical protein